MVGEKEREAERYASRLMWKKGDDESSTAAKSAAGVAMLRRWRRYVSLRRARDLVWGSEEESSRRISARLAEMKEEREGEEGEWRRRPLIRSSSVRWNRESMIDILRMYL